MKILRKLMLGLGTLITCCSVLAACGSGSDGEGTAYPDGKRIQLVIPYDPGGATDLSGRKFAELLSKELSTTVFVVNRPGAGSAIGTAEVINAKPDGLTLGAAVTTGLSIQPLVSDDVPYDGIGDVTPLGELNESALSLAVGIDTPWTTIEEFIQAAKDSPGKVSVGVPGELSSSGLIFRYFALTVGIDVNLVSYSGGGEVSTALLKGEVDAAVSGFDSLYGQQEAKKIRTLMVVSDVQPDAVVSDALAAIPTMAETIGEKGLPYTTILIAPPNLPDEIRETLVEATRKIVTSEDWIAFSRDNSVPTIDRTPEQITSDYKEARTNYEALLKKLGAL